MRLFLDTSVLLSACGSEKGASRYICTHAETHGWKLLSSTYCREEMRRNLPKIPGSEVVWAGEIASQIEIVSDSFVLDKALVFPKAKDRPVVITALAAGSAVLLTLDRMDFHRVLGSEIYGMAVRTPADFMIEMRKKGEV